MQPSLYRCDIFLYFLMHTENILTCITFLHFTSLLTEQLSKVIFFFSYLKTAQILTVSYSKIDLLNENTLNKIKLVLMCREKHSSFILSPMSLSCGQNNSAFFFIWCLVKCEVLFDWCVNWHIFCVLYLQERELKRQQALLLKHQVSAQPL